MKLWHISQAKVSGWDTYSDAVVAAETEELARATYPSTWDDSPWDGKETSDWASIEEVTAKYLGEAVEGTKAGVICASFHAG